VVSRSIEKDTRIRSERWNADETLVRLNGRHILFWTLLDERHRFLIALKISSRRTETDAALLLADGLERAGNPNEIITDGASVYPNAMRQVFSGREDLIHVSGPGL